MSATFYILYSDSIDKFYVGHTADSMDERLRKHNSDHKGFTGKTHDWRIVYREICKDKKGAYAREREVKSWKSRQMIEQLVAGFKASSTIKVARAEFKKLLAITRKNQRVTPVEVVTLFILITQ